MTAPVALFAALRGYALSSSRAELLARLSEAGWAVRLAVPDDAEARALSSQGAALDVVPFRRGGPAPLADLRALRALRRLARSRRPRLVHLFHGKPILLGAPVFRAALGADVRIVATVTGLGRAFARGPLAAGIAGRAYGRALARVDRTIFQNPDDLELFVDRCWVAADRAVLVTGSGVDLERFAFVDRSGRVAGPRTVLLLARLLRDKGIREYVRIAQAIRAEDPDVRFVVAGEEERGTDGIPVEELRNSGAVAYVGRLGDVRPWLEQADLFLFPSRYWEGVPRAVLEAAATGLPVVAFDVPGVREAVDPGRSGVLVPAGDLHAMTTEVKRLLADPALRFCMGRAGRSRMEARFDRRSVQERYLSLYRELGLEVS